MTTQTNENTACECSRYEVLVDVREGTDGDLEWDNAWTTGCEGAETPNTFRPGHDAKLKSLLIRAALAGESVGYVDGGIRTDSDPLVVAKQFGFAHQVAAGVARAIAKREAKKVRTAETLARKAAKGTVDPNEVFNQLLREATQAKSEANWDEDDNSQLAEETPPERWVTAKVGRWQYDGGVRDGEFYYKDNQGNEKKTSKFHLV